MPRRADAHIHLFREGYRAAFTARPGVAINEAACYESLAAEHGIAAALVVGYAAEPWAAHNNQFLAQVAPAHAWARPLAYIDAAQPPTLEDLESWQRQRFVGVSLYLFDEQAAAALMRLPDDLWRWMVERRWLLSINSRGEYWRAWRPILQRHGHLRILVSHLGLPQRVASPPSAAQARQALASVLELAEFPGVRVKLSGFYALTDPGYAFPHEAAWPYVETLRERFSVDRLLWGSDFAPHLDWLSFPQTFGLFERMPFLTAEDRQRIEGINLTNLLEEVR